MLGLKGISRLKNWIFGSTKSYSITSAGQVVSVTGPLRTWQDLKIQPHRPAIEIRRSLWLWRRKAIVYGVHPCNWIVTGVSRNGHEDVILIQDDRGVSVAGGLRIMSEHSSLEAMMMGKIDLEQRLALSENRRQELMAAIEALRQSFELETGSRRRSIPAEVVMARFQLVIGHAKKSGDVLLSEDKISAWKRILSP